MSSSNAPDTTNQPPSVHLIDIPASLTKRLTPDQCRELEEFAKKHPESSRKHIVQMEKLMHDGKSFEEAHNEALKMVGE
jgi:hypothetical protein